MIFRTIETWTFALTLLTGACSAALPKAETTITRSEVPAACPLGVEDATVTVEDTTDGVAMSFASREHLDELRARAHSAAVMHGPGARVGLGHDGTHGQGGQHGLQGMQLPPAMVGSDDIDGGARIRFVPADQADLSSLRTKVRQRALAMATTTCR